MVQDLLKDVTSPNIAVYVVWVPIWDGEMLPKTEKAAAEIDDARMQQFWTDDIDVPRAFAKPLDWGGSDRNHASGPVPWDLHALYPARLKWNDGTPTPADWLSPVVRDKELGRKLAELVERQ